KILEQFPYVKIVMLTVSDSEDDLFEAIKSGAKGYLLKNLEPGDLFTMIGTVAQGEAAISPSMASKILNEFARAQAPKPIPTYAQHPLTEREKQVLQCVARGDSNKEIASTLSISESTVRNHLHNILDKLHLENRVQAAIYAFREKDILNPP
ncbi:MAG: response regulator transcription factor, partial [Chloroflexi bacterium]|nr:response regulator transcription factor [Chloroflexota bacterium]